MLNFAIALILTAAVAAGGGLYVGLSRAPKTIRDYSVENDQADEIYTQRLRASEAERRMSSMILARDPAHMDEVAMKFAGDVEDYFARSYDDGVAGRKKVIQLAARRLIENVVSGGKPEFN